MQNLATQNEIAVLTGAMYDHFRLIRRRITIYKEPLKTVSNNDIMFPGYGTNTYNSHINTPVIGVFSGIKVGPERLGSQKISELHLDYPVDNTYIKIEKDANDFLNFGKTEKIEIDGLFFDVVSDEKIKNYLGLIYYVRDIKKIN